MAVAPIMPVMTDALISDTTHLSAEEFGCYTLLLLATWRNNGQAFADDDKRLALICRVSLKRWRAKLRPALVEFFDLSDGHWRQKRLEIEWNRVIKMIASKQANIRKNKKTRLPIGREPITITKIEDKKEGGRARVARATPPRLFAIRGGRAERRAAKYAGAAARMTG